MDPIDTSCWFARFAHFPRADWLRISNACGHFCNFCLHLCLQVHVNCHGCMQICARVYACACMCVYVWADWRERWRKLTSSVKNMHQSTRSLLLSYFQCWTDFWFSSKLLLTYKRSNSCADDWNVILLRSYQFWCQTTSSNSQERLLAQLVWEWMHPRLSCPVYMPISGLWLASPFLLNVLEGGQKNKGLVASVQSWYNLHSHLAWLTLASVSRLCFWVIQLILFTNNSFCSTLRVSQRERDHYKPERPHRANFTFDYGPTTGFTLNQLGLWNTQLAQKNSVWLLPLPQFEKRIVF